MCPADQPDDDRALLDCFIRVFDLKYPALWRTGDTVNECSQPLQPCFAYNVTESLS